MIKERISKIANLKNLFHYFREYLNQIENYEYKNIFKQNLLESLPFDNSVYDEILANKDFLTIISYYSKEEQIDIYNQMLEVIGKKDKQKKIG